MFESLSVIILAANETDTLKRTVRGVLESEVYDEISQIIIFLKSENCVSTKVAEEILEETKCSKLELQIQKSVTYEDAFSEIPLLVTSSHFVIMASDGEMDTRTIKDFVAIAKQKPKSIICGSKWHKNSVVENASFIRVISSKALNKFAALMLGVKAEDIFSLFQIYPVEIYKKCNANLYEYTLKPLRMGIEYIEIPTVYKREKGRKGAINFLKLVGLALRYILSVLRVRFTPKDKL